MTVVKVGDVWVTVRQRRMIVAVAVPAGGRKFGAVRVPVMVVVFVLVFVSRFDVAMRVLVVAVEH